VCWEMGAAGQKKRDLGVRGESQRHSSTEIVGGGEGGAGATVKTGWGEEHLGGNSDSQEQEKGHRLGSAKPSTAAKGQLLSSKDDRCSRGRGGTLAQKGSGGEKNISAKGGACSKSERRWSGTKKVYYEIE